MKGLEKQRGKEEKKTSTSSSLYSNSTIDEGGHLSERWEGRHTGLRFPLQLPSIPHPQSGDNFLQNSPQLGGLDLPM